MSDVTVRAEDIRDVRHSYDRHGEETVLTIQWRDPEGFHIGSLRDAAAISAAHELWGKRTETERAECLKRIIVEEML